MIRGREAPNGTTELLLTAAMLRLDQEGAGFVTLGLSPLSRRARVEEPPQPWWIRALFAWMRAHGRRFYNFEGLDAFKAKFLPEAWEPIYAISSEMRVGWRMLYAVAGAFGKTSPPELFVRTLVRGAAKELEWLRGRLSRRR